MSDLFTIKHVAQLHEIQSARLKRNKPGIGPEVEELIRRLTDGGVAGKGEKTASKSGNKRADIRRRQAKHLFDLGVGRELGVKRFKEYLATIPEIPEELLKDDAEFPLLVLVETRIGLKKLCALGNIVFGGDDNTFVAYDARCAEFKQPTWIRVQNGRKNRNCKVVDCRTSFVSYEVGNTDLQGVCAYLQHPSVVSELKDNPEGHAMDLPGSVRRDSRDNAAYLVLWGGQVKLNWNRDALADAKFGSASRREC